MNQKFSTDKPISKKEEDKFQRYGFSKRIATSIIERDETDCIVIGIYGAWGEGKTSVVNFIETELTHSSVALPIKFNPWRYSDETSLLIQFFQKLATELDANLKSKKEKAGDVIKKYGELLTIDIPYVGNLSEAVTKAGKLLGEVDIDTLKERIEQILIKAKRKVVIFIDDIDRLNKEEIHSVFRLVKLTADFPNTTYILSFDEKMVSAAIGERFGSGGKESGQNFLEKIIQVPLNIPEAQPEALKKFCFGLIDKAFHSNNIELGEDDAQRFALYFTSNVLSRLETPRLAVRYGNTLSFSLPLLNGEVSLSDLMLIEAIKIFFPEHYSFIKRNPEYFIGGYAGTIGESKQNEKIEFLKQNLDELAKHFTKKQKKDIQSLLEELFPRLNEAFNNYASYPAGHVTNWYKQKRICSGSYFNRYFSYCVIEGQLSDVLFKSFIDNNPNIEADDIAQTLSELIKQSSADALIFKIRSIEDDYKWEDFTKLAKALSFSIETFPTKKGMFLFGFETPRGQAAIFITQYLKNSNADKKLKLLFTKELIIETKNFEFVFELRRWLQPGKDGENRAFTDEEYLEIDKAILKRAIEESEDVPIFEKFSDQVYLLFDIWAKSDKPALKKYIDKIFKEDARKSIDMLVAYTPTGMSSSHPEPYKVDFGKTEFDVLASIFGKKYLKDFFSKIYGKKEIADEPVKWGARYDENIQTEINIVRQFFHWCENDSKQTTKAKQ